MEGRTYIAIDLKSFYASVECVERGLDPLSTNLVVADMSRTEKTICLAVSPALKAYGIPGRPRLFEVVQRVREINLQRRYKAPGRKLEGKSYSAPELAANPALEVDCIVAKPQMAHYMKFSTDIYKIYLKYVAPEDIQVYSIDEVFIDATDYLNTYKLSPREFTMQMILDVLHTTGITATAGIGTNLYLCKVAMDIDAKHIQPDENGVRISELTERTYRERLWEHRPLTDFWRVGRGYAAKLEANGLFTMGDIAWRSLYDEDTLYKLFGVNAELLIDHAWGWEPCTIADIKAYKPSSNSLSSGQVLQYAYPFEKARLVLHEMAEGLTLELVDKGLVTDQLVLTVCYDKENLADKHKAASYKGEVSTDYYGRKIPKHAHSSINLGRQTSSTRIITEAFMQLFERIVDRDLTVRRMYVVANRVVPESEAAEVKAESEQLSLFTDYAEVERQRQAEEAVLAKEKKIQKAILNIKRKYGKNSILKGFNFEEGATARERNRQIGEHRA